mmetsp:Transcript_112134/g.154841  ORF Transcript_112134/g.154841 Transcript_112134/m.154841 type:complete len:345 (+) Transcript_112134:677-1711(+)|eukprot:scaffold138644_cov26-Tisochrysis_lutea.AAC.1
MEHSDNLGAVVRVDRLDLEEVLDECGGDEGRHVKHARLVFVCEHLHRFGRRLEGRACALVELGHEGVEGGRDELTEALRAVRRPAALGCEQRGESQPWLLGQLGAGASHQLVILRPHDIWLEQQLGELVQHIVLVVDKAVEHVVRPCNEVRHLLMQCDVVLAHFGRGLEVADRLGEGHRLGDERGVVELEACNLFARLNKDVRRLQQRDDACLGGGQRKEHLHDLHLGEGVPLLEMSAVFDEETRQLAAVGRDENRRVLLFFDHDCGAVQHHAQPVTRFLGVVKGVGVVAVRGDHVAARRGLQLDGGKRAGGREGEDLGRVTEHLELKLGRADDEVDTHLDQLG